MTILTLCLIMPSLDATYLDHSGTTLYAKSLIDDFSNDMVSNLFGNPHSASLSSLLSSRRVEDTRLGVLQFFNADPEHFDVIFVANATAGIKLVMDAFRDCGEGYRDGQGKPGFWYGYHRDCHTSLVGVRESALAGTKCFADDDEVNAWLAGADLPDVFDLWSNSANIGLFAYPAQSNLNGRRLPLNWLSLLRHSPRGREGKLYSLLDAAALLPTAPLDLSSHADAPDFTVLSFYKIFGFPDLGALIVRKESGHILKGRRYFGGGTVDMVTALQEQWRAKKAQSLHDAHEDGTLPFHSIVALQSALRVHQTLYGSMAQISRHTSHLIRILYERLAALCHSNGRRVCEIYKDASSTFGDSKTQGAVLAFNLRNCSGEWIGKSLVEKLATVRNIHLRTGGLCNAGGIASCIGLTSQEMKHNFAAGQRCGDDNDIMGGKPTGVVRVSLGAMSNLQDVQTFIDFVEEFFVDSRFKGDNPEEMLARRENASDSTFHVESLTVFPIKSCAGWKVPPRTAWKVHSEGLAWDREWCILHLGSGAALSQRQFPKMALIHPIIDISKGVLRIRLGERLPRSAGGASEIKVSLSSDPSPRGAGSEHDTNLRARPSKVCGDALVAQTYTSPEVVDFFTNALGVPCTLARFPAGGVGSSSRHSKFHLQSAQQSQESAHKPENPILLSNESPILIVSRSSLNRLNEEIKATGGKAAQAEVFRANIVLSETNRPRTRREQPYIEDTWRYLKIGDQDFQVSILLDSSKPRSCTDDSEATRALPPMQYGLYRPNNRRKERRTLGYTSKDENDGRENTLWATLPPSATDGSSTPGLSGLYDHGRGLGSRCLKIVSQEQAASTDCCLLPPMNLSLNSH